jgi:DNA-directed RNA polymerase subunit alpha
MHVDYTKTLYLRVDKPGIVRARDIEVDQDVEILEPEAHIATCLRGRQAAHGAADEARPGYISADKNFDEDLGIGWIPVDSVHSPVKKVNYLVEAARLGQTTDYDKLTIDVWTNGLGHRARCRFSGGEADSRPLEHLHQPRGCRGVDRVGR